MTGLEGVTHALVRPKEWPLLMKGPLVRATLAGRKDVTRRLDLRWLKAKPGDLIWVKETWAVEPEYDRSPPSIIAQTGQATVRYLANAPKSVWAGKTRVSIHMPKAFSRLWLEVVAVREERLLEIDDADARREGLMPLSKDGMRTVKWGIPDRDGLPGTDDDGWPWAEWCNSPRDAFCRLWTSIHAGDPVNAWSSNPTVARIEFKRAERPEVSR